MFRATRQFAFMSEPDFFERMRLRAGFSPGAYGVLKKLALTGPHK